MYRPTINESVYFIDIQEEPSRLYYGEGINTEVQHCNLYFIEDKNKMMHYLHANEIFKDKEEFKKRLREESEIIENNIQELQIQKDSIDSYILFTLF